MQFDLLIIGGGINGCAIAREAALSGWKVMLVEADDVASHTSSASTKLIHGGLRYLETYEFGMVRHALAERKLLLDAAPHLVRPLEIVLPHDNSVRPWWMVRAGLYLYDLLAGSNRLTRSRRLRARDHGMRVPLKGAGSGFVYADCAVDDSRLTILNAVDAARAGAEIRTRTRFISAKRDHRGWTAQLSDGSIIAARSIVNAAGPWVTTVDQQSGRGDAQTMKLVKGSHIVLPSLYDGDHAYMFQQPDRRIVFAIPWVDGTTMVGTTEEPIATPDRPSISAAERAYLLEAVNRRFHRQSRAADIVYEWSGVRPLVDNGTGDDRTTTRDYRLSLDAVDGVALLSVYGGKITTARHLAEDALKVLGAAIGKVALPVTRGRPFPGANFPGSVSEAAATARLRWPFLDEKTVTRMIGAYGTLLGEMLEGVTAVTGMGNDFGGGLFEIEVRWLIANEWAKTAEDILWRRTKLGMRATPEQVAALTQWMEASA
jgi:glycerol-3-phosphate dehydrogenase